MDLNFDLQSPTESAPKLGWARWCSTYKTMPKHVFYFYCDEDSSNTSLFDWYSIMHMAFGMLYSIPLFFVDSVWTAFGICLALSVGFEVVENTEIVRQCCRKTDKRYGGDNLWNSVADVFSCMLGFLLAWWCT